MDNKTTETFSTAQLRNNIFCKDQHHRLTSPIRTSSDYLSELILNFVNNGIESHDGMDCDSNNIRNVDDDPNSRELEFMDASTYTSCRTFDNICRFCMSSDVELKKIFNDNLPIPEMIQSFTSVKLSGEDEFPKNICITCISQLKKCIAFKNQVESVDIILHQYVVEEVQLALPRNGTEFLKCFEHCEKDLQTSIGGVHSLDNDFGELPVSCHSVTEKYEKSTETEHNKCELSVMANSRSCTETKDSLENCKISSEPPLIIYEEQKECEKSEENFSSESVATANGPEKKYDPNSLLRPLSKKEIYFRCKLCSRRFTNQLAFKDHVECHQNLESHNRSPAVTFVCTECHEVFAVEQDLRVHNSLHTLHTDKQRRVVFQCNSCNRDFGNLKKLKRHIPTHFVDKPFKCQQCDRGFPEMASLTRHYRRHTDNKRERKHVCLKCDKSYTDAYALKVHIRTHTGEKPWKCSDCGKCFTDCRLLNSHRKLHSATKMYECEECGNRFTHSSNLRAHLRIHTGEKPYTCNVCQKSFTQSSNMILHMRTHTGERPYNCTECSKSFASSSTLFGHLKWHKFAAMRKQKVQENENEIGKNSIDDTQLEK